MVGDEGGWGGGGLLGEAEGDVCLVEGGGEFQVLSRKGPVPYQAVPASGWN